MTLFSSDTGEQVRLFCFRDALSEAPYPSVRAAAGSDRHGLTDRFPLGEPLVPSAPGGIGSAVQIWEPPGLGQKQAASPSCPLVSHGTMLPSRRAAPGPTVLGLLSFLFVVIKTHGDW